VADDPEVIVVMSDDDPGLIIVNPAPDLDPKFLTINEGTAGPRGPQGPPGATGPGGGSGLDIADVAYVYSQGIASDTWEIVHPLGYQPSLTVVDSAGTEQVGSIRYTNQQTIEVTFSGAFSGTAYLS
jgi:hypothetical protein